MRLIRQGGTANVCVFAQSSYFGGGQPHLEKERDTCACEIEWGGGGEIKSYTIPR